MAFELLKVKNLFGLIFVGLAGAAIAASYVAARRSQRDADLASAQPTTLRHYHAGVDVTISPIVQRDKDAMRSLGDLAQVVGIRQALPEPAGKVDSQGRPDPSRKSEAMLEVNTINAETQKADQILADVITKQLSDASAVQGPPSLEMKSDIASHNPSIP